jgi:hypothetical protein
MMTATCDFARTSAVTAVALLATALLAAQGPAPQERVAALKQSLQQGQARLRTYEWIETTAVSMKGEEKSKKQNRVYYGADGKIQKLPIGGAPSAAPPAAPSGRRGGRMKARVVENKKEELSEYMQKAVALLHRYVPPDPARLQASKDAGKVAMSVIEPDKRARMEFRDYLQPGDALAIVFDLQTSHLRGAQIATYLDKKDDRVTVDVQFAELPDGTLYQAATTLDAPAKKVRVVIENTGHRPMGQ